MLVPLIQTLKAKLPTTKITWVIARPAYDLVEGMEGIDFVVIEKPQSLRDYWVFKKQFKNKHYDVLLATQACFRTNLLIPLIHAKRKIGYDSKRAKDLHHCFVTENICPGQEHTLEGFLKFADVLGLERQTPCWNLPIRQEDYAWASRYTSQEGPILVVNPAASKPERSWLPSRYIEVLKHAQTKWKAHIILTGGPSSHDRQLADAILAEINAIDLVGKTKPKQLLAVIKGAHLVLCPDTGPSHMATAVGTPVIALHAVTNPQISGPYLSQDLVVNYYQEALKILLNKTMNEKTWGIQVHGEKAMTLISVQAVTHKLDSFFGESRC